MAAEEEGGERFGGIFWEVKGGRVLGFINVGGGG